MSDEIIVTDVQNYIGRKGTPSGQNWSGEVVEQKTIKRGLTKHNKEDTMLLVYFKNGFIANANTVKWED